MAKVSAHKSLIPKGRSMPNHLNSTTDSMISIQNLTKSFGREVLFENVDLVIHKGSKIALVGKNGTGKTTFLRCLLGQESYGGRVLFRENIKISLMEQEKVFDNLDMNFYDYMKDKKDKLNSRLEEIEKQLGDSKIYNDESKFAELISLHDSLASDNSQNFEQKKLISILNELNVDEEVLNQKISSLSGGQKVKIRLAECLSTKADIYLMDEPTNHLDLESREWIEKYIKKNIDTLITISHDEYFLKKIVDKILSIESKTIVKYKYDFIEYKKQQKLAFELQKDKFRKATREKTRLLESAKEKRLWASRYGNRSKRIMADRLERQAKELERVINPEDFLKNMGIEFSNKKLHKCEIYRIIDVQKKFDDLVLFSEVNQIIEQGEKVAILGDNGSGKTTLLKLLMNQEKVSGGKIERRPNLSVGYFDQELKDINPNMEVMKFIVEELKKNKEQLISVLLSFGFTKEDFTKKIKQLSGGKKPVLIF